MCVAQLKLEAIVFCYGDLKLWLRELVKVIESYTP